MKDKIIAQLKETRYNLTCLQAEAAEAFSLAHTSDDLRAILSKLSDLEAGLRGAVLPLSALTDEVIGSLDETSAVAQQTLLDLLDGLKGLVSPILGLGYIQDNKLCPVHLVSTIPVIFESNEWGGIWCDAATLEGLAKDCNTLWIYLQGGALDDAPKDTVPAIRDSPLVGQLEELVKIYNLRVIDLKAQVEVATMTVAEVARKLGGFEALRDDYSRRHRNQHAYGEEVYFWTRALAIKQQHEVTDQKPKTISPIMEA